MEIELEWQKELSLKYKSKGDVYEVPLKLIPEIPGIYIFGRRHGKSFEALYIGQALELRSRIKTQLNNHKLLNHIWAAKAGKRILMIGKLKAKQKHNPKVCLGISEKALIRYFVSKEHDLVNLQGIELKHHGISSIGLHKARDFPNHLQVEVK